MAKKLILLFFLVFVTSLNAHAWSEEPEKYKNVLYPDGMPAKEYKDGVAREASYEFLAETQYDEDSRWVAYVEKYPATMDDYSPRGDYSTEEIWILEGQFICTAFMALINIEDNKVVYTKDFSGYIYGGPYVDTYANLNVFSIEKDLNAIHVELATQVSGTGHQTFTDDLFFIFNNYDVTEIFKIVNSEVYARGWGEDYKYNASTLYVADADNDGTNEIFFLHILNEQTGEKEETIPDAFFNVYKFNYTNNAYEMSEMVRSVPENHIVLRERFTLPE